MVGTATKAGGAQNGSPLLVFLTALLVLVGIVDVALWSILALSLLSDTAGSGSVGAASNIQTGGESARVDRERDPLEIYVEDMQKSADLEDEAVDAYNEAKDRDDATLYAELNDHIIPLWQQLQEEAGKVSSEDPEIVEFHELWKDYSRKRLDAYIMMASALSGQNDAKRAEAEALLQEANDMAEQGTQRLQIMARERNLTL